MITHRNAYMNVVGTLIHIHMTPADRYLWTLPMFHANGWTFVWIVTAVGGAHVCLRRVAPDQIFPVIADERITMFCAAPTVLIGIANAPAELRKGTRRGLRVLTAGAPPAAATIAAVEGDLGWEVTQVYGLTETAPFITVCEPRPEHAALSPDERATIKACQGVELITSGESELDVQGYRPWRFGGPYRDPGFTTAAAREVYRYYYRLRYPLDTDEWGRPQRLSPLHGRLQELGAVFGTKNGWERADYFRPGQAWRRAGADQREFGWTSPPYLDLLAAEHRAFRERVGIIDSGIDLQHRFAARQNDIAVVGVRPPALGDRVGKRRRIAFHGMHRRTARQPQREAAAA